MVDSETQVYTFADVTKLISKISCTSDKVKLQQSLDKIMKWSICNNMQLNRDKFELLCFSLGTNKSNKVLLNELPFQQCFNTYLASDVTIEPTSPVRDLGVFIDNNINWSNHYNIIVKKAKRMCSWIFSSIYSRDKEVMLVLFGSLVRSGLEYCCEVWSPHLKKDVILLEQIQRSFTNRISGQQDFDYWQRLKSLKISSLQRRREMLIILHVWKIKNKLHPNTVGFSFKLNKRSNAVRAVIRPLPKVRGGLLTKFDESFLIRACKLWNIIPPDLSQITALIPFKSKLKKFLDEIPDEPPLSGYPVRNNNSLLEQCL